MGMAGFGTRFTRRQEGMLPGDNSGSAVEPLEIDYASNARSLGAIVFECQTLQDFEEALKQAHTTDRSTVITVETDRLSSVPGYESWWDVPVAEVSQMPAVQQARQEWEDHRAREKYYF